jgi:hypothetical protein
LKPCFKAFSQQEIVMKHTLAVVAALALVAPAALAQTPAATADTRGPGSNIHHKTLYCVKNAESGACEDCWSDGKVSSARGTCNMLKASTNDPNVRKGKCALPANQRFCGLDKKK